MQVQVLPFRLRIDSLSAHTEQARFLWSEALNRAQSDDRCGLTLALIGSSYDETEPKKAAYVKAGRNTKPLTSLEFIPAEYLFLYRQESRESSSRNGYI